MCRARSARNHHFSGCMTVAASTARRAFGKRTAINGLLRIRRIYIRKLHICQGNTVISSTREALRAAKRRGTLLGPYNSGNSPSAT